MSVSFSMNILLHVFYLTVIVFNLWSCWAWTAHTFTYFIWLKVVPLIIVAIAVFLELINCGVIVLN